MTQSEDQREIIGFLSKPKAFAAAGGGPTVETVETHISVVFITGEKAFKLKRAVRFPYLDFSTAERRRHYCEAELALNRRTAPQIYRAVVPVTREADGGLAVGGTGAPVDWLVEMTRFDGDNLFDRLATRGRLDRWLMERTAEIIADFHGRAEIVSGFGGRDGITVTIDNNAESLRENAHVFDPDRLNDLIDGWRKALAGCGAVLDRRTAAGLVRRCHGDLHLRNICLIGGRPTLFDCIEFKDEFACIDVLYDLAFLLMDLDHRGLRPFASIVLNRYLDGDGDGGALAAMPLFLSLRAGIRAHVSASTAKAATDPQAAKALRDEARIYLDLGRGYLDPPPPRLVAVGGLSGSGKSRMARDLSPKVGAAPGARVVRTDVVRKRLFGASPTTRLPPEAYTKEMSERTYAAFYEEIRAALATGHSVIADAVFAREAERAAVASVAAEAGVPFNGLWLEAAPEIMEKRIRYRRGNVSDATVEVLHRQLAYDLGNLTWDKVDSGGKKENTIGQGLRRLGL